MQWAGTGSELQLAEAGEKRRECDAELASRQRRTDAVMDAGAKRQMRSHGADQVRSIAGGEARGIAIRGTKPQA